ncbi:flagellar hook-length control protein FliK [Rhabdaerophilum sp. SD176]|uniref:flagellar hook-length control protein FliK n=1 Tax=Rhabdaerophilum sp. SD176 TaxID=2983548 RepID=UPI0024DFB2E7|nr:flagellar hook-length control protein FliK [Rhabdaerophilum sp. SD176]
MSSVLAAAAAAKIQEIRAQSLATMLAAVSAAGQAGAAGARPGGSGGAPFEAAQIRAILVEMQGATRALVQLAGGYAEVELPPALLRQAAVDPSVLKQGALLLLPADVPARPVPGPATAVTTPNPAVPQPQPGPAGAFPPGSLGATLGRMTGLALPAAEALPLAGQAAPNHAALRPVMLPQGLPAPLAEAVLQSAARQLPLAPVLTALLGKAAEPGLPPALQGLLQSLQGLRASPASLATPEGLQSALARSGLFLETNLARTLPGQTPPADLKSQLAAVRRAAEQIRQVTAGTDPGDLARLAEGGTERIKLMQLASLPAHPEIVRTDESGQGFRLTVSVPLAPQGPDRPQTAMMGLMIEHQPDHAPAPEDALRQESAGEGQPFPWKVRIALDLEETGPVEAEIGLRGQSVSVQVWAEQPAMARLARQKIGDLHSALSGAAFEITRLDVHDGRSAPRPSLPNPYLDRRP